MGQYHELAGEILKGVGGIENIKNVRHCIARLRFTLKDEKIAQDETIGNLDGAIQVMRPAASTRSLSALPWTMSTRSS